jgi:predicted N-formylglutamate amidohydrolase
MYLTLRQVKEYLRVTHDADDALLESLLAGAEEQAMRFLGTDTLEVRSPGSSSSTEHAVPPDVVTAVLLMVRADYEADKPEHAAAWRDVAYERLYSYRQGLGV